MKINNVQIQTIDSCNAKCISCPHRLVYHSNDIIRQDVFNKFVEELKEVAANNINIFLHLENEPLLDPYLFNRVKYIKNIIPNSNIGFVTNGLLLYENLSNIKSSNINNIMVSLDGYNADTYNIVHNTNITKLDWNKMVEAYDNLYEYSLNRKNFNVIKNRYYERNETPAEFLKRYFISKNYNYTRGGILKHIDKVIHNKIKGCTKGIPYEWFNLLADGSLILCCMDYTKSIVLGNIKHQTLEDIYNSKLYKTIMSKINGKIKSSEDFICKSCELAVTEGDENEIDSRTMCSRK